MSKESKLEKKEAKAAKKAAKADKVAQKSAAKAEKQHAKAYDKFVKDTTKKNASGEKKAAASGTAFTPIVIPPIDEFQSKAELKAIKANDKAYDALVKKIQKKNTKMEAKCAKKGQPFVPIAVPEKDEVVAQENKKKKIFLMILMILLIWLMIYFIIMWINYVAPVKPVDEPVSESESVNYDYETYSNPHEITTTPDYSIADAKRFLQQVIHDNWKVIGYSSDVSATSITYNNKTVKVNNANCYVFSCSGKTYAVPVKLSGCYVEENGKYEPLTFNNTDILF